jgi:hypothetical protein
METVSSHQKAMKVVPRREFFSLARSSEASAKRCCASVGVSSRPRFQTMSDSPSGQSLNPTLPRCRFLDRMPVSEQTNRRRGLRLGSCHRRRNTINPDLAWLSYRCIGNLVSRPSGIMIVTHHAPGVSCFGQQIQYPAQGLEIRHNE